jgi:hypothetical protein
MLGDNNEKSKNPLKKAMRRRNAKNVNFAPPTYIEASDVEYSSDEDSEHGDFFNDDETLDGEEEDAQDQSEDIVVEPLRPKGQKEKTAEHTDIQSAQDRSETQRSSSDRRPSSEEFFESEGKNALYCSRAVFETHFAKQNPLSVDPEMALYETPTRSSKTTQPSPRRFLSPPTCCAMNPAAAAAAWPSGKR